MLYEETSERWQNSRSLAHIPQRLCTNSDLAAIQGQKHLQGSFGIQLGGCETLVKPKARRATLRRQAHTPVAGSLTAVLATDQKRLFPPVASIQRCLAGVLHQLYLPGDLSALCNRPSDLGLDYGS